MTDTKILGDVDLRFDDYFFAATRGRNDVRREKITSAIHQARAEERASLRHDMIVKMHGWHGTGLAMINDYFKRLTKKD